MPKLKLAKLSDEPEIFHTLQGEGVSMGIPAVFVRSSLCNLHCTWCDTDYTWNFKGTPWRHENDAIPGYEKHEKNDCVVEMEPAKVAEKILSYNCHRLIITGGEPMLQQEAWLELILKLKETEPTFLFEIETNGTIKPSAELEPHILQFNVSPKLANSGNSINLRQKNEPLEFFAQHPNSWFKFVIAEDHDLLEIEELINRFNIPSEKIILMPEGRTQSALKKRRNWVADACKTYGFRFCDRLHIQLWGSKRGV